MAKSVEEIEKNVSASFGYVKKDMLMLNDAISEVHDKIQHLSLNHASLLEQLQRIENAVVKDEKKLRKVAKTAKKKPKAKKKAVKKNKAKKKSVKNSPKKVVTTEEITYS